MDIVFDLPEFPQNDLGLKRGTVLQSLVPLPSLEIPAGIKIILGFDGQWIRGNGKLAWSISKLEEEINHRGYWGVVDEIALDALSPEMRIRFSKEFDLLDLTKTQPVN